LSPGVDGFPIAKLHHKNIRHTIIEFYAAWKKFVKGEVAQAKRGHTFRRFNVSIDVWEEKITSKKYLGEAVRGSVLYWFIESSSRSCPSNSFPPTGVKVRWMNRMFQVVNYTIACREFNPSSTERENNNLSKLIMDWTLDCMAEVGLQLSDVYAAVSDSGSDVKCAVSSSERMGLSWEWCGPHMINRALEDGYGYCEDKAKSKNLLARAQIMDMRRVNMHIMKSSNSKVVAPVVL